MDDFKWIGKAKRNLYEGCHNQKYTFYQSFSLHNVTYSIEDFIVEKKNNEVCRLLAVYESAEERHKSAPYKAFVQRYTYAHDIDFIFDKANISYDEDHEIVEDGDSINIEHNLEFTKSKCTVITASTDDIYLMDKENSSSPTFFCRYRLHSNKLSPIKTEDGRLQRQSDDSDNQIREKPKSDKNRNSISLKNLNSSLSKQSPLTEKDYLNTTNESNGEMELLNSKTKAIKITTPAKNSVKRNLCESFESDRISIKNYSIIRSDSSDSGADKLKLKLRVSNAHKKPDEQRGPIVLLENLTLSDIDKYSSEEYSPRKKIRNEVNKNYTTAENIRLSSKRKEAVAPRRSTRNTSRVSYAELFLLDDNGYVVESKRSKRKITSNSTYKRIFFSDSESSDSGSDSDLETPKKRKALSKVAEEKIENKTIKKIKSQPTPKTPQTRSKRLESISKNERKFSSDSESSDFDLATPKKGKALSAVAAEKTENKTIKNKKSQQTPRTSQTRSKRLESTLKNERKLNSNSESNDPDLATPNKRKVLPKAAAKTPRTSSRRLESTPRSTPRSCIKSLRNGIITPSLKSRDSIVPLNTTPLMKARAQLHVSFVPTVLPCREKEYQDVYNFLKGKLTDNCGGCMYVSGVPGTGKTATVTSVIQKLTELSESNKRAGIPKFTFVSINGMKLTEPRQAYVEILRQLTKKTVPWEQAQSMLDEKFTKVTKDKVPIVLLIDELDILCTKRQDVVYTLLDWPSKSKKQLIIVTIANTMDLPERLLMSRVTSRLGLTRLTFQAYTYKQLQEIVTKRLTGTNSFNPDAVQLVARKVASVSGDARRALDICRKAAEIAEVDGPDTFVTMTHINEALGAMMTQPKVQAIKHCSRLDQLMLQAIVAEVERTGVEETVFSDVYKMLQSVSVLDGFQLVNTTIALKSVARLNACRLIIADQKCDISERIILNVSSDDVYYALKDD